MPATVVDLYRYDLTLPELRRLSKTEVTYSIHLEGPGSERLFPHRPRERLEIQQAHLHESCRVLQDTFDLKRFLPRDSRFPWMIDATSSARVFCALAKSPLVRFLMVDRIQGRRRVRKRPRLSWFSVRARVAIQIEGQTKGLQQVEDRIVMVRAYEPEDAVRRLEDEWREYATPYLNSDGEFVRWQLEEIVDVVSVLDDLDQTCVEVWSSLANRRMKKEYEWHGEEGWASEPDPQPRVSTTGGSSSRGSSR